METTLPPASEMIPTVQHGEMALGVWELNVALGSIASFTSHYDRLGPSRTLEADLLRILDTRYRGQGIGERLLRRLVREAKDRRLEDMESRITSEYALDIRGRVFGKENLEITPGDSFHVPPIPKPEGVISFDEARDWLARVSIYENLSKPFRLNGFDVYARFSDVEDDPATLADQQRSSSRRYSALAARACAQSAEPIIIS